MMHVTLREERKGDHVHTRVFAGEDKDHPHLLGTLVFTIGEWQLFGACLIEGFERMKQYGAPVSIETPDAMKVVGRE